MRRRHSKPRVGAALRGEGKTHRTLRIEWEGPLVVSEAMRATSAGDYGVYQIYARHVVFGAGALVYVGRADDQTFGARLRQHRKGWLRFETEVEVRLGRLHKQDYSGDREWSALIKDAEALTTYWHTPPYNSKNIVEYVGSELRIQNWHDRGALLPEVSSHWPVLPPRPDGDSEEPE